MFVSHELTFFGHVHSFLLLPELGSTISSFFSGKKEEKDEAKAEEAKEEEKAEVNFYNFWLW